MGMFTQHVFAIHAQLVTRIKTSLSWMAHRKENNCLSRMSTFRLECDYRRVKGELEAEKTAHEQTRERANGDTASSRGSSSSLLSAYRSRRYSSQADMAILQEKISIGFDCGVQPSLARRTSAGYASSANILSEL